MIILTEILSSIIMKCDVIRKIIKDLELKIYELQLEIDYLKRLLTLHHIKYE